MALMAALLAGYGMASSPRIFWLQTILFAAPLSAGWPSCCSSPRPCNCPSRMVRACLAGW
uniref:Uncharacterized protein n=1 Tax=mine drainage metagenome TaxID=410659 RepID=E6QC33_9ZZZZ